MIVKCMSKEIMDGKIKVSLSTPYEREMVTRGDVTIAGTYEETKHIIVGREYEVVLNEVTKEEEFESNKTVLIKGKKISTNYECELRIAAEFDGFIALFRIPNKPEVQPILLNINKNDFEELATIKQYFKYTELPF